MEEAKKRREQSGQQAVDAKIMHEYDKFGSDGVKQTREARVILLREIDQQRIWQDEVRFGKEALYFTNKFRESQGKRAVVWCDAIAKECYYHSRDMGMGISRIE